MTILNDKNLIGLPLFSRVLFLGFGDGSVARKLMELYPQIDTSGEGMANADRHFAFYEPDIDLYNEAVNNSGLKDIFSDYRFSVFAKDVNERELTLWLNDEIDYFNSGMFSVYSLDGYDKKYPKDWEMLLDIREGVKERVDIYTRTKKELIGHIIENNLCNLGYFVNARNTQRFVTSYPEDLPFVIISAGPSLAERLDFLKRIKGKAFLMATDSASKYLLQHDITPDGILCIDPRKELKLFDEGMRDIPFFVDADVNHKVLDTVMPRNIYFINADLQLFNALAEGRGDSITPIDLGGSVATAAFSFAITLGVKNIVLVGQDLSVKGETSHITDAMNRVSGHEEYVYVEGNEELEIKTYTDFCMYIEWFEREILRHSEVSVFNYTAGGAKINGARYCKEDECPELFLGKEKEYKKIIGADNEGLYSENDREAILHTINEIKNKIEESRHYVVKGVELCTDAIANIPEISYMEYAARIDQELNELNALIQSNYAFELVERYASSVHEELMANLYEEFDDKKREIIVILDRMRQYYEALIEAMDVINGIEVL